MRYLCCFLCLLVSACVYAKQTSLSKECALPVQFLDKGSKTIDLDGSCIYKNSLVITKSDTILNCNGATLDGFGVLKTGILITGNQVKNITIKNCRIQNFSQTGIMVKSKAKYDVNKSPDFYYKMAPSNIVLTHNAIDNSGGTGITLNAYVTHVKVNNSKITNSNSVGIYLSQSSRENEIYNNEIANNGNRKKSKREGLAVDSSAYNVIKDNVFSNNGAGGIFLYKNCGEHADKKESPIRWQHSDYNKIIGNVFSNERKGIWIASRQSMNLKKWGCGDQSVDDKGIYYKDYANNNYISGNRFCSTQKGIVVEGDNNSISDNFFDSDIHSFVLEPYKSKVKPDGTSTTGNKFSNNRYQICQ